MGAGAEPLHDMLFSTTSTNTAIVSRSLIIDRLSKPRFRNLGLSALPRRQGNNTQLLHQAQVIKLALWPDLSGLTNRNPADSL
jgi:hypothetical protein